VLEKSQGTVEVMQHSSYNIFTFSSLCYIAFFISHKGLLIIDFPVLFTGILLSVLLAFPSNLWNHCNDLKEDIAQGKKTILTKDTSMHKPALFIAVMLYAGAMVFAYYVSKELNRPIFLCSLIWALTTCGTRIM